MGKGFNNYMCKKFFHPASRDNLKRVWMAEQKSDSYKKKQEELRIQYEKEQDLYTNKAMLSKESKDKLSVNFMYEPPPGAKKEREREDNEPEYKFEWQRKFNAPREDYCKGDSEIRDQPFGIQVRNVRCIKCHKWGHINTDKECPLYNQASSAANSAGTSTDAGASHEHAPAHALNAADPLLLMQQMRDDGLAIKRGVLEAQQHLNIARKDVQRDMIPSDDEEDDSITQNEKQFLKSLSKKQKLKLLRKLEKMEQKSSKKSSDKKNKKKDKNKKKEKKSAKRNGREREKNGHHSSESSAESSNQDDDEKEEEEGKERRREKRSHSSRKEERKDKEEKREKEMEKKEKKKRSRSSSLDSTCSIEERDDGSYEKRGSDKKNERKSLKDDKVSNGKHRRSRYSDEDDENSANEERRRRRTSSKKSNNRHSSASTSDKKSKERKSSRKRKSSSGSDSDSGYGKRHRK